MKLNLKTIIISFVGVLLLFSCQTENTSANQTIKKEVESSKVGEQPPKPILTQQASPPSLKYYWQLNFNSETSIINQIITPRGFQRVNATNNSFQQWLQFLPLFPAGQKVKTYDGSLKWNQQVHARVVDIDVGKRDLQQCADAVMRLRAEFLFVKKQYRKIHFNYTNGTKVSFDDWRTGKKPIVKGNKVTFSNDGKKDNSYSSFKKYLIQIFSYAGTASLEKEMKAISLKNMQIGDVFIQGGHPGHAIIIVDMAENTNGKKLYLLAQSYMPAQNIHILNNPTNKKMSPWYELIPNQSIHTPEWDFSFEDLKRFVE
jgi:hypothetical protein